MSSFAVGGNIDDEADAIEPRFVQLVVFAAAVLIIGAFVFLGTAYLNSVSYTVNNDSFTIKDGSSVSVIIGLLLASASMVLLPVSIMYATGELSWSEVPKGVVLALPFGLLFSLIVMAILTTTQPSINAWVQDRYQVQSISLPQQSGLVYALDAAGNRVTFQYTELSDGSTLKHVSG
jgi:hypothetical protein